MISGAEDDPAAAVSDLKRAEVGPSGSVYARVLYIGISCGLSATYVGAQLKYAMDHTNYAMVVIGFNPPQLAKSTVVSGWGTSFKSVLEEMQGKADKTLTQFQQHFVLTPVVGPEAVQGSSRLKGGTATKMILEAIMGMAASQTFRLPLLGGPPVPLRSAIPQEHVSASLLGGFFNGLMGGKQPQKSTQVTSAMAPFRGLGREIFLAYEVVMRAVYTAPVHQAMAIMTETLRSATLNSLINPRFSILPPVRGRHARGEHCALGVRIWVRVWVQV